LVTVPTDPANHYAMLGVNRFCECLAGVGHE
jgi:hypothetical protein